MEFMTGVIGKYFTFRIFAREILYLFKNGMFLSLSVVSYIFSYQPEPVMSKLSNRHTRNAQGGENTIPRKQSYSTKLSIGSSST